MSGMNTSDARQNSKNKTHYQRCEAQKTWETHKAKRVARHARLIEKRRQKIAKRLEVAKPKRGHARTIRRAA